MAKDKKIQEASNSLNEIIKDVDQAVLITAKRGNIEVTGIKNTNYAHEAKGLIIGALDSYNIRPITSTINNYTKTVASLIKTLVDDLKKSLGVEVEEKQPEKEAKNPEASLPPVENKPTVPAEENKDKSEEKKPDEKKESEKNEEV